MNEEVEDKDGYVDLSKASLDDLDNQGEGKESKEISSEADVANQSQEQFTFIPKV